MSDQLTPQRTFTVMEAGQIPFAEPAPERRWPDIMIDIETLGTTPTAPILEISAFAFDLAAREMGPHFDVKISLVSNEENGRIIEANTLRWWMFQWRENGVVPELRGVGYQDALADFEMWLEEHGDLSSDSPSTKIWARGSLDTLVLEHAFRAFTPRRGAPWRYFAVRDQRTLTDWYGIKPEKVAHEGLRDCIAQIHDLFRAADLRDAEKVPGLKQESGAPDFAGAWAEYRRNLAETSAVAVPPWDRLSTEIQESFCSALWYLLGETAQEVPSDQSAVISRKKPAELFSEAFVEGIKKNWGLDDETQAYIRNDVSIRPPHEGHRKVTGGGIVTS